MFRLQERVAAGCVVLFLLVFFCTASSAAVHEIVKGEGRTIEIPVFADGDTLAILGTATLADDDWRVLREIYDATFHLALNAATTSIPDYALSYSTNLLSVAGSGVVKVGNDSFYYCSALAQVTLPLTKDIGDRAFYGCGKLPEAIFPQVTAIGHLAFAMCASLARISFPAAQTTGGHSFAYCTGLTEISFPALTEIGSECFSNCSSLSAVSLPAVKEIGSSAFSSCTALTGASFPSAENVGYRAFGDCTALESLSLPSVKEIGDYAFTGMEELSFLELGTSPPVLGDYLFDSIGDVLFLIPDGASGNYGAWPGGTVSEGRLSHGGTLLLPPGESLTLSATLAPGAVGVQWQRQGMAGAWSDIGGAGGLYAVSSLGGADGGQYALAFQLGGVHYRTAPVRLVVGTDPVLTPEGEVLTVPVGRSFSIALYAEGVPLPGLSLSWLGLPPDGVVLGLTRAGLTGVSEEVGVFRFWAYAENAFSLYSGHPVSRVYALDVVDRPVTGVELNKESTSVLVGGAETLYASVIPENAANRGVRWSSDRPSVALVYPGGRASRASLGGSVLGLTEGTATITVTTDDGGMIDTCLVTVSAQSVPATELTLDRSEALLSVGESLRLVATVTPAGATDQNLAWSSANPAVAVVGQDGHVSAVAPGTTSVTVRTEDGRLSASCAIRVVPAYVPVHAVLLNKSMIGLLIGGREVLYATVLPENATNKEVVWSSADPSVASVTPGAALARSRGGTVSGLREGRTAVTATAVDGGASASCSVLVSSVPIPVAAVSLDRSTLDLDVGETMRLVARVLPPEATDQSIEWSSEDAGIASVDQDGFVTGVAEGATVVAAAARGNHSAACETTVWDIPELALHPQSGEFLADGLFSLRFRVTAKDGGTFPAALVAHVQTIFSPSGHAMQCGWLLENEGGSDELVVTGHLLSGSANNTFIERVVFDFEGGRQRTVLLSPEPSLSSFMHRRSGGGCDTSRFAVVSVAILGLVALGGALLSKGTNN